MGGGREEGSRDVTPQRRPRNLNHFYIEGAIDRVAGFRPKSRFLETMDAITLLREIEASERAVTDTDKRTLARFAGFGGIPEALDPRSAWRDEYRQLRDAVDDDDFRSLNATVLNAHYTSPVLVRALWTAVENMGFDGGRVLEPAVGVGNFLGLAPRSIVESSDFVAVEKDQLSARITQALYPDAKVYASGYENVALPDRFVDLAIGNIPFGKISLVSEQSSINARYDKHRYPIHDYFIAKTLDHLKPGGVMAFITSRYTLDKAAQMTRARIEQQADFLGAVRLPGAAHKEQAGTGVVTDIVFLRKRVHGEESRSVPWVATVSTPFVGKHGNGDEETVDIPINQYFINNPEMVIGEMTVGSLDHRGGDLNVDLPAGSLSLSDSLEQALETALDRLPRDVFKVLKETAAAPILEEMPEARPSDGALVQGSFVVLDSGAIGAVTGSQEVAIKIPKSHQAKVGGMIQLRDLADSLLQMEAAPHAADADCDALREKLNVAYTAFVATHGRLTDRKNARAFRDDPRAPLLLALEMVDAKGDFQEPSAIFEKRVVRPTSLPEPGLSVDEAFHATLAHYGKVVPETVGYLSDLPWNEALKELKGKVYKNPENDEWESAEKYLSGNVRDKLDAARVAADIDEAFRPNVEALLDSQPTPLEPGNIHAHMGAPWLEVDDVRQFVAHVLNVRSTYYSGSIHVFKNPVDAHWEVRVDRDLTSISNEENREKWGTYRVSAVRLIQQTLNQMTPLVKDSVEGDEKRKVVNKEETLKAQMQQTKLKAEFTSWLWSDPDRTERASAEYNRMYNNVRTPQYDGSHLTFPGMNANITLHKQQRDAAWRAIQSGNALLAHEVGAGKTWAMVAIAAEWKRLGKANKPLIAVPNHMLSQFAREARELYPAARIWAVDKRHLSKDRRQQFIGRVATGDWDMVIMTHFSFSRIGVSSERQADFINQELDEYRSLMETIPSDASRQTKKNLENKIVSLEAKMLRALDSAKDDVVSFEQMGVDALIIDESHMFKNLDIRTSISGVAGLSTDGSDRSMDLLLKTRYLYEKRGSVSGVVFASGTPVTNSIAGEVYTLQRYLQPDVMAAQGTKSFDAFAAVYTDTKSVTEIDVSCSEYKQRTRLTMVNIPELISSLCQVMDVKTSRDLNLERPNLTTHYVEVDRTPNQALYMADLASRVEDLKSPSSDSRDNMLLIGTDGRKVSLDMRVVDPSFEDHPDSKINHVADNVFRIWEENKESRAAQLVFIDLSVPKKNDWNLYDDLKTKLLGLGIPPEEIAYAHDAATDETKDRLFAMVRSGEIRVLIGSSDKMGAGTNVQKRLKAIHQVDPNWRPDKIKQRRGRIERQGNDFKDVEEYIYTTRDTFDLYMWQTVAAKEEEVHRIMHGDKSIRSYSEEVDPTFADLMAITTGNPLIRDKLECDNAIAKLELLRSGHLTDTVRAMRRARQLESHVNGNKVEIKFCWSTIDQRDKRPEGDKPAVWRFGDKEGRKEAVLPVAKLAAMKSRVDRSFQFDGLRIQGVPVRCYANGDGALSEFKIANEHDSQSFGVAGRAETYILSGVDIQLSRLEKGQEVVEAELQRYQVAAKAPFAGQQELEELVEKRTKLILALDPDNNNDAGETPTNGGPSM